MLRTAPYYRGDIIPHPRRPLPIRRTTGALAVCVESLEDRLVLSAWYVAPYGVDTNPGTLQQPFATIQQAAEVAQAGDDVFIRGGTYHETVIPVNSGTADAPITFEPYNNESVMIDGADAVTGWTSYQGKIYEAPQSWDLGEGNNQVFVDGKMLNEARYPNTSSNVSTPTWAKATSISVSIANDGGLSTATLYNSALNQPAGAWVGAMVHIATGAEWVDQVGTITASSPGSITFSYQQETSYQVPKAGNRFYIVGSFQALNSAGEWYRDPNTGLLYLWDNASDNPAKHTVEAKARQYAFDLSGLSYVNVEGISLFACTINTDSNSTNNVLDHLTATYVSHAIGAIADNMDPWGAQYHPHTSGIILNGQDNILTNSTVSFSSGDGVFVGGSNNTVQNCVIHDVDYEAGDEAGITTLGDSESILHNTIFNTGRSGIVFRYTTHSRIDYNVVHNVGIQMTDLGAIYTFGSDGEGTEIGYNLCYNVHTTGYGAAGIYLDNGSQNFIVDHNVVYNADFALKMNPPCWNDTIVNNTFSAYSYGLETSGNRDMTGSVLMNNIFTKTAMLGTGLTQSHNIFFSTNPLFVNVTQHNYQLQATSPAIDAGGILSPFTDNFIGSAPDIGAYEFGIPAFATGQSPVPFVHSAPPPVPNAATNYFSPQAYAAQWAAVNSGDGVRLSKQWAWIEFKGVDFGSGVQQLIAQVSSLPATALRISIRIDKSTGPVVGTLTLPATKQPSSVAQTLTAAITGLSGVHDLYLMLIDPGSGGVLDGFTFV